MNWLEINQCHLKLKQKEHFLHFLSSLFTEKHKLWWLHQNISADVHLVSPDSDDPQLFIVIDNEVFLEVDSYSEALFALVGVHYVFNLEYPKKLKYVYQFLEEYVFGIPPKKRNTQYRKGVSTLLVDAP